MTDEIIAPAASAALLAVFAAAFFPPPAAAQEQEREETSEHERRVEVRAVEAPGPRAGGWLGVRVADLDAEDAAELGWDGPRGARVGDVTEGSPAAEAGLAEGDVIVRFDGESVRSVAGLTRLVRETPPGREVGIRVVRDGGERSLTVEVGDRPGHRLRLRHGGGHGGLDFKGLGLDEERLERIRERTERARKLWERRRERMQDRPGRTAPRVRMMRFGGPPRLGVRMQPLTDQLAEHFGVGDRGGVFVASVREGSAAGEAGLEAGDVVVRFGDAAVDDPGDLAGAVHEAEAGSVPVTVVRDGGERTLTVDLPERRRPHGPGDDGGDGEA